MTKNERRHKKRDTLSLASFGFFLFLIGVIWMITPNLFQKVIDFFKDFKLSEEEVFPFVFLPAPAHPHRHLIVYTAVARFCFAFGLFQIVILILMFIFRETVDRIAGKNSEIAFWLGVGFVSNLLAARAIGWFGFLGWFVVVIGLSLVVKNLLVLLFEVALRRAEKRTKASQPTEASFLATYIS